jgi:calcium-dependent protein kinase
VYLIEDQIGEGTFGKVYMIRNIETMQVRACKKIKKGDFSDTLHLKNEIGALLKLNHPNLVKLIEIFEDTKRVYLV